MRWLIISLAAVALAAGPALAGEPTPLEWVTRSRLTGTQVRPRGDAKLMWTRDGEAAIAGTAIESGATFARLDDPDRARVRLLLDGRHVHLAVYAYVTDLWPVATRPALVHPSRRRALARLEPDAPGIHLDAGAPVEIIRSRRRARARNVAIDHGVVTGRGYVDGAAIGIDFKPISSSPSSSPSSGGAATRRQLTGAAALRDRPGGAVVARLSPAEGEATLRVRLLRERGKHALIAYGGRWSTAVGWVPRARLKSALGTGGGGMGFGTIGGSRVRLRQGTVLRDRKDGAVIGVVTETARFRVLEQDGEHKRISVRTDVGLLSVWASDERVITGPSR